MENRNWKKIGWANFLLIGFAFMISYVHNTATGTMAESLNFEMGLTNLQLAGFASMYVYAYTIMQIPAGYLIDKLGVKKVIMSGVALMILGSFMFSYAKTLTAMYVFRFVVGAGAGVCFGSMMKTQAIWFKREKFQTLTGLTSFMANMGGMVAAAPLAFALGLFGWRGSFRALSFITVGLFILMIFVLKGVKDYPPEYLEQERRAKENKKIKVGFKGVFTPKFIIIVLLVTLVSCGEISFFSVWAVPYFRNAGGYDNQMAANVATLVTIGIVGSTLLVGFYDKWFKNKKMMLFVTSLVYTLAMVGVIVLVKSPIPLMIASLFVGFSGNIFFLLGLNQVRNVLPSNNVGVGLTTFNFLQQFTLISINYISGFAVDKLDGSTLFSTSYYAIPILFAIFGAIGTVVCFFVEFKSIDEMLEEELVEENA